MTSDQERRLLCQGLVHIEVTSTLTQEDENQLASAVMKLLSGVLEMLPVAYMIRIETTDQHVLEHVNPHRDWSPETERVRDLARPYLES